MAPRTFDLPSGDGFPPQRQTELHRWAGDREIPASFLGRRTRQHGDKLREKPEGTAAARHQQGTDILASPTLPAAHETRTKLLISVSTSNKGMRDVRREDHDGLICGRASRLLWCSGGHGLNSGQFLWQTRRVAGDPLNRFLLPERRHPRCRPDTPLRQRPLHGEPESRGSRLPW